VAVDRLPPRTVESGGYVDAAKLAASRVRPARYVIEDDRLVVLVTAVASRGAVYRDI
jgi:hypothetical protein